MQIKSVEISHFRSIESTLVNFSNFTALIGSNNSGKSTILRAIDMFFEASPRIEIDDHYYKDPEVPIIISCVFGDLTPQEREEFGTAIIDGHLNVSRELGAQNQNSGIYSVSALVYPPFQSIREEQNGNEKRKLYTALREEMEDLPAARSVADVENALDEWEENNEGRLEPRRVRGFFGAINVANGKLKKKTSVRLVPAVKDAGVEFSDARRSPVLALLRDIAQQTIENRKELQEFLEGAEEEVARLTDPEQIPQLTGISEQLTESVRQFYVDTELIAHWEQSAPIEINFPEPRISVSHREVETGVEFVGHGLQRAILFALVHYLAQRQDDLENGDDAIPEDGQKAGQEEAGHEEAQSDIVLLVEEPEIYQHPTKQNVIYDSLKRISDGFNRETGIRMQVIYATHSEKFIRMPDFDCARIIRKTDRNPRPETVCSNYSLQECSNDLAAILGVQPMPPHAMAAKLHIFSREISEGFFAERIILVEGPTDKAILEGAYLSLGREIDHEGLAVISVGGKTKLDKPALIFKKLGIPTYVVLDNDRGDDSEILTNRRIQQICDCDEIVDYPTGCQARLGSFDGNLERYFRQILGDDYEHSMNEIATNYSLSIDDIKKTPAAVSGVFQVARARDVQFELLDQIVYRVDALPAN